MYPEPSGKAGAGSQGRSPRAGPPDLSMDPGRREGGTKPAGVSVEVQAAGGCREHVLTSQDTQRRGRATVTVSHWYVSRLLLQSHSLRVASPASPPPSPTPPRPPAEPYAHTLVPPSARLSYLPGRSCVMQRLRLLQSPSLCGPPCVYFRCVACSRGERFLVCLFAGQLLRFGVGWSCVLCLARVEGWTHVSVVQPSCSWLPPLSRMPPPVASATFGSRGDQTPNHSLLGTFCLVPPNEPVFHKGVDRERAVATVPFDLQGCIVNVLSSPVTR